MREMDHAMKLLNDAYWTLVNLNNDPHIDRTLGSCCVQAADYVSEAQGALSRVLEVRKREVGTG